MKIVKNIAPLLLIIIMSSCLDLQGSYDYEPYNCDPYLGVTAWEFIEQRQDTFSILKQAIERVDTTSYPGMKNFYTQTDKKYTFLFLNDAGFTGSGGVFANEGVSSVSEIDSVKLRDILFYHIVDGNYHSLNVDGSLNFSPMNVITLLKSQDAVMTMNISNENSRTEYSRLYINESFIAVTSNLIPTNGVIHVFSQQLMP